MRVLLDTQVFIDAYLGERLPKRVRAILEERNTERLLSAVTLMELAIKSDSLTISEENVRQAVLDLRLTLIPFTPQYAYRLFQLPNHHRDPFDRMLIATALVEDITLIGADRIFNQYAGLQVLWK